MSEKHYLMVPFHGTDLTAVEVGGDLHIAVKPVCDAIGIDWSAQRKRIMRDPILSTCVAITAMQVPGEIQNREVLTLPISHLNGFLFGITASRTRPEVMDALILYQRECYRVLHDYWMKGAATNPRASTPPANRNLDLLRLIDAVKVERHPTALRLKYDLLEQELSARGMVAPALEEFAPTAHEDALADTLLAEIEERLSQQPALNHHRRSEFLAFNRPELESLGLHTPTSLLVAFRRHPRFVKSGPINCVDGKIRACWVFSRNQG